MAALSLENEKKKRAIFDSMSLKRQKHILKKTGYDQWDPFEEPKDPIDIRKDKTKRTTQTLVADFLRTKTSKDYSNDFGRGALEVCLGIINNDEKSRGMYEFSCWYYELLEKEGIDD